MTRPSHIEDYLITVRKGQWFGWSDSKNKILKWNILAANAVFVCTKHNKKVLDSYFNRLDEIFKKIAKFENKELNIDNELETDVCQTGFKRLN